MQKIRILGFFSEDMLHWQFEVEENVLQVAIRRLHIYLCAKKTLIHNLGAPSAVTMYSTYLCLNLLTMPDLKF
jgi:hypothetical protein